MFHASHFGAVAVSSGHRFVWRHAFVSNLSTLRPFRFMAPVTWCAARPLPEQTPSAVDKDKEFL